jgi:hypothetical protein
LQVKKNISIFAEQLNYNIMKEYINQLKSKLNDYNEPIENLERKGIENLSLEETEDYGFFLGQKELLEEIIPNLEKLYSLI